MFGDGKRMLARFSKKSPIARQEGQEAQIGQEELDLENEVVLEFRVSWRGSVLSWVLW